MQLTRSHIHDHIYYYGLLLIAISLPVSVFLVSSVQILLALNFLLAPGYRQKWERLRDNTSLWIFLVFFLIHVIGLLWTGDIPNGLNILKIKLPLLVLPLIIAGSVLPTGRQIQLLFHAFVLSVLLTSVIAVLKLAGWFNGGVLGYRDLSPFVHHIRFGLMVAVAIFFASYFLFFGRKTLNRGLRIMYLLAFAWLPVFLLALKSLTGIMALGILFLLVLLRMVFIIRDPVLRYVVLVALVMVPLASLLYVNHAIEKFYTLDELLVDELDSHTVEGNRYTHKARNQEVENGHYVWIYVCDKELEREWNRVSRIRYDERNLKGERIRHTLIRFLTSRGLRKDAHGLKQLSEADIRAIERGVANHIYMKNFSLYPRIYEVIWEFHRYSLGNAPNGKSILQRYLYLQASWSVAREHLFLGVGTGDELVELHKHYDEVNSALSKNQRRGPHNEYMSALITLGFTGLLLVLASLVFPLFIARKQGSYLASGFLVLILGSMLSSGTLGSSTGASLVGLFYSLFLFGPTYPWLEKIKGNG